MTQLKLVACGDGAIGKTSMLVCYAKNEFPEDYVPTVFDNYSASVMIKTVEIKVQFWDTAGQEEYESIRPLSYPSTDIFLLCFSVVQPVSLTNVAEKWFPEVKKHCPSSKIAIVGLKIDLRESTEQVELLRSKGQQPVVIKDVEEFVKEKQIQCNGIFECSAKTKVGLKETIESAVKLCVPEEMLNPSAPVSTKTIAPKKKKCVLF
ncbi:Rho GTPase, putative [Entamoeba invadens IP1]|uniref:small monomeric GTPase n=1 Tax=Entamoeba invadens IP1 TaxID=370355 RepID=A0A0A1U0A7_ENTIV|nr:Rho GTPase, putative [Entamoeba invadens IP1]ELP87314.1 Rho GTPase, putative [Entamoeba invadens IP1]|eukprot:XP_004254085.1 Rho GTPase, putative [Entamoeba invadens IP1]